MLADIPALAIGLSLRQRGIRADAAKRKCGATKSRPNDVVGEARFYRPEFTELYACCAGAKSAGLRHRYAAAPARSVAAANSVVRGFLLVKPVR